MKRLNFSDLKEFLDEKVQQYKTLQFIEEDPIQVPKKFTKSQDIEIAAFITATIAWGNRKSIIKSADNIMQLMDYAPYDFVLHHRDSDLKQYQGSLHRTFMVEDLQYFVRSLKRLYLQEDSIESWFLTQENEKNVMDAIIRFREAFTAGEHRALKHVSNPAKNSSAKRLNMFLRWMVRKDQVDFGIWQRIPASKLCLPLDVHTGNVGRKLGILKRKQNDRKAVEEITAYLRQLNPNDPIAYDFALFGIGAYEEL